MKNFVKNKISINRIILTILITIYMIYYLTTLNEWHFIDYINLIFHESGHIIFYPFGEFIGALGGTLMQIIIPLIFIIYFYKRKDKFSASIISFWLGQNFFNIYIYIKDAIVMELPLLGGDSVFHDWNYILSKLNILKYTENISYIFYIIGIIILIYAFVFSIKFSIKDNINEKLYRN